MLGFITKHEDSRAGHHDLHDFSPGILGVEHAPPSPLPRMVLRGVLLLFFIMLVWSTFGRLDIVAVAEGKLVPVSYLKIVQPAEAGIVREIAVRDGENVVAGQVLVRMDANVSDADGKTIQSELQHKSLELRRIEAELANIPFRMEKGDAPELFHHIEAEYLANLGKTGFAGNLMVLDKQRERIEKEQDLKAQEYTVQSLKAAIAQSEKRLAQISSSYRQKLQAEKTTTFTDYQKLQQDWAKQEHRASLLELKAPQAGIVKDLATHTPGTVVSPGTVLMTLVPNNEALQAEVWVKNEDAGFVHPKLPVKIKLAAFPFQKYGMIDGSVTQVSADASESPGSNNPNNNSSQTGNGNNTGQLAYRTLVAMHTQTLNTDNDKLELTPGMQVAAEIKLGDETVLEYLLSPVRKAFHEAGRER